MADPEVHISSDAAVNDTAGDIEMLGEEGIDTVEVEETATAANGGHAAEPFPQESNPPRTTFIE